MLLSADGIMGPCVPTPDAAEMVPYTFRYSVLPHEKGWRESSTYRYAIEFNMPLIAVHLGGREVMKHRIQENIVAPSAEPEARSQIPNYSFLEIQPRNVILSTLKLNERYGNYSGDHSLVVRIYETEGRATDNVTLVFYRRIKSASIIDLQENEISKIPILGIHTGSQKNERHDTYVEGNTIRMSIGAFKIVSLKVDF